MNKLNETTVRPCTSKELAAGYGVSTKTLRTWLLPHLQAIGTKQGRYFTALQIRIIHELIGVPD